MIKITEHPIDPQDVVSTVHEDSCGAVNLFIGTVRSQSRGKKVSKLYFETYLDMAIKEIEKIIAHAKSTWEVESITIYHRIGTLTVGEVAVAIAVSAAHREASFKACQYAIDTLKETVPIWKKEVFTDGEEWVSAYP